MLYDKTKYDVFCYNNDLVNIFSLHTILMNLFVQETMRFIYHAVFFISKNTVENQAKVVGIYVYTSNTAQLDGIMYAHKNIVVIRSAPFSSRYRNYT